MNDRFPQIPHVATLPNGLRAVAIPMPWRQTVSSERLRPHRQPARDARG